MFQPHSVEFLYGLRTVSFGFPILLGSDFLAPAYRWRLLDSMFQAWRSAVEGAIAVSAVAVICLVQTHNWIFAGLLAANVVVLGLRLLHGRHYLRVSGPDCARSHSPEHWAVQFSIGALAASSIWLGLDLAVFGSPDVALPFLVLIVQSGWLGASSTRAAAFPAVAFWQTVLVLAPAIVFPLFSHSRFIMWVAPFGVIQIIVTTGITRTVGALITAAFLSEQRLEVANARLTELSATDGLTGIANRRSFDATFQIEWARAARHGSDLGLLMIDVDSFKAYNDHYGHPAGDACLRMVADLTSATLRRPPDTIARFGGEEFIALLPGTDGAGAMVVAERVRMAIVEAGMAHAGSAFGRVTISIGSASLAPHPGQDRQGLIDLADRALYEAKHSGRNKVCCAGRCLRIGA